MGAGRHFDAHPVEYTAWVNIRARCLNTKHPMYKNYGARGIRCCAEWADFEKFFEHVGPRPSALHSIDRYPDNNGSYEPGNVRWATRGEQMRNMRRNRYITAGGETMILQDWARRLGMRASEILKRIASGFTEEEAVTLPRKVRPARLAVVRRSGWQGRMIEHNGERRSMAGWARHLGITRQALHQRLRAGCPLEIALATPNATHTRLARPRGPNWPWKTKAA